MAAQLRAELAAPPAQRAASPKGAQQHAPAANPRLKQATIKNWPNMRCTSLPARSPSSAALEPLAPPPSAPPSPPPAPTEENYGAEKFE